MADFQLGLFRSITWFVLTNGRHVTIILDIIPHTSPRVSELVKMNMVLIPSFIVRSIAPPLCGNNNINNKLSQ